MYIKERVKVEKALNKKIERKVRKVGSSLTVTLPKDVLEFADINEGDTIEFSTKNGDLVIKKREEIVSAEFMKLVEEIYNEQEPVFKALVER
ncbi:AbrB/MazE/SpoVT family DNA-binding domain-containing protein [Jeotgalibaca ciconiae]|uniref:AbrB/MazE/SpoVT family DNA-binding domain-containing protein n=1 Tax=Jeotgalibaca ciconiae TaxID=2496265 RepID=A0A3Q9BJE2_9LACT|nr:AbrB/MazE/SpoVT family DNA-binding domain-containing protein [Jeotgalibaca ciconiae]